MIITINSLFFFCLILAKTLSIFIYFLNNILFENLYLNTWNSKWHFMLKMSYFSRKNKIWEELDSQFWDYFIIFNQVFSKNVLNRNTTKHTISQIKHEKHNV